MKRLFRALGVSQPTRTYTPTTDTTSPAAATPESSRNSSPESSRSPSPVRSRSRNHPDLSELPSRPRRKAEALAESIQSARERGVDPEFIAYAETTLSNLASHTQPSVMETNLDIRHLDTIVQSYRYNNLNLEAFNSKDAFVASLVEGQGSGRAERAVVRDYPNLHHFAADVRHHEDGRTTVIILEPASAGNEENLPGYTELASALRYNLGPQCRMVVIEAEAQKSLSDCVAFALDFALVAYQERRTTFDQWHENLAAYGTIADNGVQDKKYGPFDRGLYRNQGIYLIKGWGVLPPVFYKHAHSHETLKGVEKRQPGSLETDVSTGSNKDGAESLEERMEAFSDRHGFRPRNISIEASRARKIRHALES
ncbi:type III secretion system YopJ family effector PopP1 [Ralstonia pseudosolanacearum]|uniref:PopP1 protein n=1 Tax=Ralstonia solanacearum TaxID=305 RepID=Q700V9_RALSL|nr:type III secretion system YopJ family effector PopP1 [Ralstonia pseudosolanacearum]CAF32331.1 PopP1 protein [Ralstonia solanacearum]